MYWALRSKNWGYMGWGWGRDHFIGRRKLEGKIQLCSTTRERLQPKACWTPLLPEVYYMGKLVVGEGLGSGGPRSLGHHGS